MPVPVTPAVLDADVYVDRFVNIIILRNDLLLAAIGRVVPAANRVLVLRALHAV